MEFKEAIQLNLLANRLCKTIKKKQFSNIKHLFIITEPKNGLNAEPIGLKNGSALIAFNNYTIHICTKIALLIEKYIPKWLIEEFVFGNKSELTDEPIDPMESLFKINGLINIDAHRKFEELFFAFIGVPDASKQHTPKITKITEILRDAIVLFIMGHEYMHLILNHYEYEGKSIEEVWGNWDHELIADSYGYELMRETMSQKYYNVNDKAFFNFGIEIFIKFQSIRDLLLQIFQEEKPAASGEDEANTENVFEKTHPDPFSRIVKLREMIWEQANIESEEKDSVVPLFIMELSNVIFDIFERRISLKILHWASKIDNENMENKEYLKKLFENCFSNNFSSENIKGEKEWESCEFTNAICEFAKGNSEENFKRVLAVLYVHEYEKHESQMKLMIGQLQDFRDGVNYLEKNDYNKAVDCFEDALKNDNGNSLVNYAWGYACSKRGKEYFDNGKYSEAIDDFNNDIENSPVAGIESFYYRSLALSMLGRKEEALQDMAIVRIISLAPSLKKRTYEWLKDLLKLSIK